MQGQVDLQLSGNPAGRSFDSLQAYNIYMLQNVDIVPRHTALCAVGIICYWRGRTLAGRQGLWIMGEPWLGSGIVDNGRTLAGVRDCGSW